MVDDPNDGELLPDGSRIQETTAGELANWLAENPPQGCGCENPQPFQLCCPAVTLIPTVTPLRGGPKPRRRKR